MWSSESGWAKRNLLTRKQFITARIVRFPSPFTLICPAQTKALAVRKPVNPVRFVEWESWITTAC
jgi:hypothetical protein